jgi:hypothetical protein
MDGEVNGAPTPTTPVDRLPPSSKDDSTSPNGSQADVNWDDLRREFGVSEEFIGRAQAIFQQHSEILRRLA